MEGLGEPRESVGGTRRESVMSRPTPQLQPRSTSQILHTLHAEFLPMLAQAMIRPVAVFRTPPIAAWLDTRARLNHLRIYRHVGPDVLHPDTPLVVRISCNRDRPALTEAPLIPIPGVRDLSLLAHNTEWSFEMSLLPEEVFRFTPWIAALLEAKTMGEVPVSTGPERPAPHCTDACATCSYCWTDDAFRAATSHYSRP